MSNKDQPAERPADPHALEAPLVLPADQLERVVGGTTPRVGPLGPTNGLIRMLQ